MLRDLLAGLLGRYVDREIARLTRERDQARADRDQAATTAVRYRVEGLIEKARADALAEQLTKGNTTS